MLTFIEMNLVVIFGTRVGFIVFNTQRDLNSFATGILILGEMDQLRGF